MIYMPYGMLDPRPRRDTIVLTFECAVAVRLLRSAAEP
jgi:hypothetical protein